MPPRRRRLPLGILFLVFMGIQLASIVHAVGTDTGTKPFRVEQDQGGSTINLSTEALASIASLDDHPVEDNDAARADRMLASFEAIPEEERLQMGLDVEKLRVAPFAERLARLEELWAVRQLELKEAYDAIPTVNELLKARLEVLQDPDASESTLILALTDLEDLLSDIDMARDYYSLGGFPVLASMLDLSRSEAIREVAAWTIGTSVKNQPEHQLWVLEVDASTQDSTLSLLLKNAAAAATYRLRTKLVYALSACLRNNVDVQLQFGSLGGAAILSVMYDAHGSDSRLRTKILLLLSDLLQEAAGGSPAAVLATMPVGSTPKSGGVWCGRVDEALQEASSPVALEKALEAIVSFAPSCGDQFAVLDTKQSLVTLAQQCRGLTPTGSDGDPGEFQEELAKRLEDAGILLR